MLSYFSVTWRNQCQTSARLYNGRCGAHSVDPTLARTLNTTPTNPIRAFSRQFFSPLTTPSLCIRWKWPSEFIPSGSPLACLFAMPGCLLTSINNDRQCQSAFEILNLSQIQTFLYHPFQHVLQTAYLFLADPPASYHWPKTLFSPFRSASINTKYWENNALQPPRRWTHSELRSFHFHIGLSNPDMKLRESVWVHLT